MRVLILITARGGSVGIPRKSVTLLQGRPLIAYTAEAALQCGIPGADVICSTDDEEIAELARAEGVETPFLRPAELATAEASHLDVVFHALEWCEAQRRKTYDAVILLQPTSPFRNAAHIKEAFALFQEKKAQSLVAVYPTSSSPFKMYTLSKAGTLTKLIPFRSQAHRKQDYPTVYQENGAIFIFTPEHLKTNRMFVAEDSIPYLMDATLSLDIDTPEDMLQAERLKSELQS